MIVVTAMPVVNAKARTITTKIVFMTLVLCSDVMRMPEPARRSVTAITEQRFGRSRRRRARLASLSGCIYYNICSFWGAA
jgi:hypothetical protein